MPNLGFIDQIACRCRPANGTTGVTQSVRSSLFEVTPA